MSLNRGGLDLGWEEQMGQRWSLPTAFEQQVQKLGLNERTCAASKQLREWCERNKEHCYIPEWLLKQWEISVDADLATPQGAESLTRDRHSPTVSRSTRPKAMAS
jgi:hypothetical protein